MSKYKALELLNQRVFDMPVSTVLMTMAENKIPQYEVTLSSEDDTPKVSVIFLTDTETIKAVKQLLASLEA